MRSTIALLVLGLPHGIGWRRTGQQNLERMPDDHVLEIQAPVTC